MSLTLTELFRCKVVNNSLSKVEEQVSPELSLWGEAIQRFKHIFSPSIAAKWKKFLFAHICSV